MSYESLLAARGLPDRLEVSEVEARRFGLAIGRFELGPEAVADPEQVRDLVLASGLDVVVVRFDARAVDWFARLLAPDLLVLHADTLVYYGCELAGRPGSDGGPRSGEPVLRSRTATTRDLDRVGAAFAEVFASYTNHYSANPLLAREAVAQGYQEWSAGFVGDEACGRSVLLLEDSRSDDVAAVSALSIDEPGEIVLAGVTPAHRRQGAYPVLLEACEKELASRGCRELHISTQVNNLPVIRAWSARGYRYELALQTVHLIRRELLEPPVGPW